MSNDTNSRFADQFLDDFFAEAEEHLTAIRRNLLALEAALPSGAVARSTLDEMFRSFHTLKGISGMVELSKAETLAHDMESYLRALVDGSARLTSAGVEAVIDGTRMLEHVIAAFRDKTPQPDIEPTRKVVLAAVPERPAATHESDMSARQQPLQQPASEGMHRPQATGPDAGTEGTGAAEADHLPAWRVMFTPSSELLQRGMNVNVVRERLRAIGEIVEARPTILSSGGIAFEFTVRTDHDPAIFEEWRLDGISTTGIAAPAQPERLAPRPEPVQEPGATAAATAGAGSKLVRVDLARLDDVMRIVADIVVTRGRLAQAIERSKAHVPHTEFRTLQENSQLLERQIRSLRDHVMRVRLVPVREIFSRMPFVIRDLARDNDKQVRLEIRGQDTEIDKFLIERMMDPILHLVRNAIAHGIETPAERVRLGKSPTGVIGLHASMVGEMVVIEVEDDGKGIDFESVVRRAHVAGLETPAKPDAASVLELLCTPGFSTRDEADRASGRGVGMAVVKRAVEQLAGTVEMDSQQGQGTRFVITLPLTLAIIDAIICTIGGERFAVPQNAVREVLEVQADAIRTLENNEIFPYRGGALPLVRMNRLMSLEASTRDRLHVFVIGAGLHAVGLAADRIIGQREIVVRAVSDPLVRIEGVAGATELGDGKPVLILDPAALVRAGRLKGAAQ